MSQGAVQAVVAAGNLLFFPVKASASEIKDVVNASLVIELITVRVLSKFSAFNAWRRRYFNLATEHAWQLGAFDHADSPPIANKPFSLWDVIRAESPTYLDLADINRGEETARQWFADNPTHAAVKVFASQVLHDNVERSDKTVSAPKEACFLLSFVGDDAKVVSVQVRFTSSKVLSEGFLFEPFMAKDFVGNISIYYKSMILNMSAYSALREMIEVKLKVKRPALVHVLD